MSHLTFAKKQHERGTVITSSTTGTNAQTVSVFIPATQNDALTKSMLMLTVALEAMTFKAAESLKQYTRAGFYEKLDPAFDFGELSTAWRTVQRAGLGENAAIETLDKKFCEIVWTRDEPNEAARAALLVRLISVPIAMRIQGCHNNLTTLKIAIEAGQDAMGLPDDAWAHLKEQMRFEGVKRLAAVLSASHKVATPSNPLAHGVDPEKLEATAQSALDDLQARREAVKAAENALSQTINLAAMICEQKPDQAFAWLSGKGVAA